MSGSEFASSPGHAEWCWAADPESVPSARHAVLDFLEDEHDLDPALADVALAVSEAVANVVLHAYPDGPCGMVHVAVELSSRQVLIDVSDDGDGMEREGHSGGLGLGMPLMATLSDGLAVDHPDSGGTHVRMRFRRGGLEI